MQIQFIEKHAGIKPLLLLDDVFSELDQGHIDVVLGMIGKQQTIITTTHEEFVKTIFEKKMKVVKLQEKEN
jgi:DNA replication and repair protein RecF